MCQRLACLSGVAVLSIILAVSAEAAPARKGKPRPPSQITVVNTRAVLLAGVEVTTTDATPRVVARLKEGLAAGQTVKIKLVRPSGCSYSVRGTFEDGTEATVEDVDICADATLRFTE
jgi:hypothetical protein